MEDGLAHLFHPDVLDSQYYWGNFHPRGSLPPEKMLMLAVLEDAIGCIQKYAQTPNSRAFRDAAEWVLEEKSDWLFSFENVCAVLGLDAEYLREGLLTWRGKKEMKTQQGQRYSPLKKIPKGQEIALRSA